MANWIYQFLASLGYTHPIHPALVHIPIGNVVAAFVFGIIGLFWKNKTIGRVAYYTMVLAFVSLFPVIFFGVTDWLRYYGGAWLFPIKIKIILSVVLSVILLIAIVTGRKDMGATALGTVLSFLGLLAVTGLGYFGANLVYSRAPAVSKELEAGRQVFAVNCRFCHPQGGNIITPSLTLLGAPQLSDSKTFTNYIRNPALADRESVMPAFGPSKISDEQAKALYDYVTKVLQKGAAPRAPAASGSARAR